MPLKKIQSLNKQQTDKLAEYRDRWIKIGLSTDAADRPRAEAAIKQMYVSAGLEIPRKIVWCGSPLSQGLTRAIILDKRVGASVRDSVRASVGASVGASVRASVRASVGDSVWDSVGDSVRDSVRASVGASVRASVGASVGASVWDSVRDSVGDSVWDSVRASVWDSVWASVGASVRDSVRDSGYGQHDANWLAFYLFFREQCGLTAQTEKLTGYFEQAQTAGWYLPHQHICWVSERHHILVRDDRGRLHCETSPAVMYPDGWAIYAWHGVRVPANIIGERDKITVGSILKEQNTEVRRVMRNLYGNDRFMIDAGANEVDHAVEHGATLLALQLPGDPVEIRMMRLTCPSTGSVYFERVPPDVRTALEGLSWRFNVKPAEYQPDWQT